MAVSMNMESWFLKVDCHICKTHIFTKDSFIISVEETIFGVKGLTLARVCKECHRDSQLNKLV